MEHDNLIACHECDTLFQKPRLLGGRTVARCPRCGATLYQSASRRLDGISAMTLAALFTFLIAQGYPILELDANGITSQTTLFGALVALWNQDMQIVAVMVFCATTLFPLTELVALLYVLIPIRSGYVPPGFNQFVRPWGMIEVFMLGVLITIVKMVSLARVIPEAALFAFGALTLMFAVVVMFDPRTLWDIADELNARRARPMPRTAADSAAAAVNASLTTPATGQPSAPHQG
jgi:paraquat-inducible protein A